MNLEELTDHIIDRFTGLVYQTVKKLRSEIAEVREEIKRIPAGKDGEKGDPGKDAVVDVDGIVAAVVAKIPAPKDGKDADPELVKAEVAKAVAALPTPKDGKDAAPVDVKAIAFAVQSHVRDGKDADPEFIRAEVAKAVAAIPIPKDGKDGKSVDVDEVVSAVLAKVPTPKNGADGKDADPEFIRAEVAKAVAALPKPRDGEPGKNGESVHPDTVRLMVAEEARKAFAALQLPKDGAAGRDGRDALEIDILPVIDEARSYPRGTFAKHKNGLWRSVSTTQGMRGWECLVVGIADFNVEQKNERHFCVTTELSVGDPIVKDFSLPVVIYREIYRPETEYSKGDAVTYGGSFWVALVDFPTKKPGDPTDGTDGSPQQWRLAVKKGAPGKDSK